MINQVLISAAGLGIASLLGSAIGLLIKKISHRLNDIFLGFCAGMMLAASIVCLIMPAIEMVSPIQWWQIIAGVAAGVGLICTLDYVTPHLHHLTGIDPEIHHSNKASINRILLFVLAIAIHKLPEGMATGIVFEGGNELKRAGRFAEHSPSEHSGRNGGCHSIAHDWSRLFPHHFCCIYSSWNRSCRGISGICTRRTVGSTASVHAVNGRRGHAIRNFR